MSREAEKMAAGLKDEKMKGKLAEVREWLDKFENTLDEGRDEMYNLRRAYDKIEDIFSMKFEEKNCRCDEPTAYRDVHEGNMGDEVYKRCLVCGGYIEPRI